MYIQLQADTQEIIDDAKPMICFFCVPKDTENVRANIRGLITQLFKARNYEGPGRYKYTADSLAGIEVCFMSEECFKSLVENTEEIALGIKNLVALLGEDKTIYHRWPKPALPTEQDQNPTLTVDRDSVFQATRYLDPLAVIGQKFTIADIVATATTDAVVSLDPIGQTTLALEAKADKAIAELEKIDPRLETTNTYLGYLYQAFYASFDIVPIIDQNIFSLFRNALFDTGFLADDAHLRKISHGAFESSWTLKHFLAMFTDNKLVKWWIEKPNEPSFINGFWQNTSITSIATKEINLNIDLTDTNEKLGKIGDIYTWLTDSNGLLKLFFENITQIKDLLDYHLGEVQYGIKHFFNIFAVGEFDANLNFYQKIKKHWAKPTTEDELQLLQNSIFQNNPDYAGRGFTLYDWLAMWVKPHGDNWQGNGYVNPSTNIKGHELVTGSNEQLDTLIDRFSLAFLQTSNTPILGKIRDILETGLLFSSSLGILTLINDSLQSIYGVLSVDLGWIARSTEEIAAKDCCGGANSNGSTTVTNPDGSTTTTPNPPTYPPIDPNDPESPTREPYPKSRPDTSGNNRDGACGFIWFYMNLLADWLEWLFNLLDPLFYLFKAIGWVSYFENIYNWFFPTPAYGGDILAGGVYLAKVPSSRLRSLVTGFYNFLGKYAGNANVIDMLLTVVPATIRAYADDAACGANGQPEPTAINGDDLIANLIEYLEQQIPSIDDLAWSLVGQAAYIVLDYFMSDTTLADYEQYCPCPSSEPTNWAGLWNSFGGNLRLTQTGNSVTGVYETVFTQLSITATANGKSLTGTWIDEAFNPPHEGTITWQMRAEDWDLFTGTYTSNASSGGAWGGTRLE